MTALISIRIVLVIANLLCLPTEGESTLRSPLPTWREVVIKYFADFSANRGGLPSDMGSRRQDIVPNRAPFPCQVPKFSNSIHTTPTSVHRLRPQDIDVIASLGDSISQGFGALANSFKEYFRNYPEVAFSIGGAESWRSVTTIPNLIREFNPNLIGFVQKGSNRQFGMAVSLSHDEDVLRQAKELVRKMKNDSRVDFKRHWKMVTIMTGHNDICITKTCFPSPKAAAAEHAENLKNALDYLQDNMPRTFVNLIPFIDVSESWKVEKSLTCGITNILECRCLYLTTSTESYYKIKTLVDTFHSAEQQLVESGRYDTKEDFAVVFQPFAGKVRHLRTRNFLGYDIADLTIFSVDCFHLSQKGHGTFATMLWNNMLQPEGHKNIEVLLPMQNLMCPTKKKPYFFTRLNSKTFLETGTQ